MSREAFNARLGRRVFPARPPLSWMARLLACRRTPDLFYSVEADEQEAALFICQACPVMAECRADVLTWPDELRDVGMTAGGEYWPTMKRMKLIETVHPEKGNKWV